MKCLKCKREYKTGLDNADRDNNEYSVTYIKLFIARETGYKVKRIEEDKYEASTLCPECARELFAELVVAERKFINPELTEKWCKQLKENIMNMNKK